MRRPHEVTAAIESYSPAEERFNRRRRSAGLVVAPALFLAVLLWPMPGLPPQAHRLAAIMAMVVALWITEALPMAVTALLGPVLAVVLRVAPAREAFSAFADPIIFLFIGSFILAEAMFVHGLDRRVAFTALSIRMVGTRPARVLVAYGAVSVLVSMWISNTATAAMMFPIGLSIVAHLGASGGGNAKDVERFALAMMLMTSFAASVGGVGTPVGSPPNLIGIGMLERTLGIRISFFQWMLLGIPVVVALFAFLALYFHLTCVRGARIGEGSATLAQDELQKLGPMSAGQRNVLFAFGLTVALWLLPGVLAITGAGQSAFAKAYEAAVPESVAAIVGAILLFVLPIDWRGRRFTLTWDEAVRIDWGIILLFGGGLALGTLTFSTGLAESMGKGVASWLPSQTPLALTILFTGFAIVISEAASNTASANMIVPVAIAVAQAAGVRAIEPALGATLGASMGFMMPISTPPNAIIYSSGHVPITAMMRHGIVLDVAGFVVIVTVVTLLGWIVG